MLQEEMEQAELEAAIALSLAVEEEKLRLLKLEAKHEDDRIDSHEHADEDEPEKEKYYHDGVCEEKGTSRAVEVVSSKLYEAAKVSMSERPRPPKKSAGCLRTEYAKPHLSGLLSTAHSSRDDATRPSSSS